MLKRFAPVGGFAAAVLGVVALGGCPVTQICSPTDLSCQSACVAGDLRPHCQVVPTTGTLVVTWTVNGQPAGTACGPANAANVRFSLGGAAPALEPCASGSRAFAGLTAGSTTLQADLIDAAGNVLNGYPSTPQTIVAGNSTNVAIMFTAGAVGTTGGVKFTWTVGMQAAATACPAGSMVKFESTVQPSTPATSTVACSAGAMEIVNLPAGAYTFKGSLLNGAATPVLADNLMVTINAGSVADFSPVVDFAAGTSTDGAAVLSWTINAGQRCPAAGGTMNVTVTGGPTTPNPQPSTTCGAYMLRIPNLAVGTYTFDLSMANPAGGQAAAIQIPGVAVMAGVDTAVATVDMTCSFCPTN